MKVNNTITLPNGIGFSIIEIEEKAITALFENRYLVVLEIREKRILPKNKQKFVKFKSNGDIYTLKSDVTFEPVQMDAILYQELKLCDQSLESCNTLILSYMAMYNQGQNLKKELSKAYKI